MRVHPEIIKFGFDAVRLNGNGPYTPSKSRPVISYFLEPWNDVENIYCTIKPSTLNRLVWPVFGGSTPPSTDTEEDFFSRRISIPKKNGLHLPDLSRTVLFSCDPNAQVYMRIADSYSSLSFVFQVRRYVEITR
jgi:hypothetical protein